MNSSLNETMIFVSHLKSKLFELQKCDLNFLIESSAGEILLSNIFGSKCSHRYLRNYAETKVLKDIPTILMFFCLILS